VERVYGKLIFLVERNFNQYDGVRLHFAIKNPENRIFIPKPLEYEELPAGGPAPEFMNLNDTEAQSLMDSLYDCGYRPTRPVESAGQVEALQNHLGDMRRLVFSSSLFTRSPAASQPEAKPFPE
jgi:hypothetical protein